VEQEPLALQNSIKIPALIEGKQFDDILLENVGDEK
jgi:hypothetical protein